MELFQSWSSWSKDAGHVPKIPPPRPIEEILDKAGLKEGQTVLDVGAGIGWVAIPAAHRLNSNGKVIALEPAEDSRTELLRYAQESDVGNFITVVDGQAEDIPLDSESVDVVLTNSVLIYVLNKEKAITEFCRILRPNGTLVCSEPLNRYGYLRSEGFYHSEYLQGLGKLGERISELIREHTETYCKEMIDFTEHDLLRMCWKVGFRDVSVEGDRSVRRHTLKGDNPLEAIGWDYRGSATQPTPHEYLAQHLSLQELEEFCSYVKDLFQRGEISVVGDGGRCILRAVK